MIPLLITGFALSVSGALFPPRTAWAYPATFILILPILFLMEPLYG